MTIGNTLEKFQPGKLVFVSGYVGKAPSSEEENTDNQQLLAEDYNISDTCSSLCEKTHPLSNNTELYNAAVEYHRLNCLCDKLVLRTTRTKEVEKKIKAADAAYEVAYRKFKALVQKLAPRVREENEVGITDIARLTQTLTALGKCPPGNIRFDGTEICFLISSHEGYIAAGTPNCVKFVFVYGDIKYRFYCPIERINEHLKLVQG